MAYNLLTLKKLAAILLLSALPALPVSMTAAGQQPNSVGTSHLMLIMPFENASNVPGIDWVGEAFPEVLSSRLNSASLFVINRSDRLRAFDELGIPLVAKPSRATIYQIAQQMDADYVLMGRYNFDGNTFIATAQILDMTQLHLSPELTESGPLTSLIKIQTAVAWDVLSNLNLTSAPKDLYVAAFPPLRLDAMENYVRGVLAGNGAEKIKRFKEAIRLEPTHTLAILHLGKIYYGSRDFEQAVTWLSKVPDNDASANEAHFYLGLAAYYSNQMDKAEAAFRWLASRLPLTEVYNNLGVVVARRGERRARGYFEKSVQTDPNDPDYRFNLAVELYRDGDTQGAVRQLRDLLALQPDADARAFLDSIAEAQSTPPHLPLERIKVNYDESSFRQLSMEITNLGESRLQKLDPASHAAFHVQRGRQLLEQGMPGEAENEFRGAILLNPANPEAHAALAGVLESLQDNTGARNEARVSLTLAPSSEAYMVLARLDLAEKNAAGAQQNVESALALDPANSAAASLKQDIVAALSGKAPSRP